ncbi:unnamed protein product, partial [Rotaria socialis]
MNLVSKPTENQFNSRGQDVLPLTFKLFPQRSESVDNGNRTPPSNNTLQRNLSQPDIVNSIDTETLNFKPIPTSPFRLFGSTTSASSNNSNTFKKLSTTDKVRRKRTPKIDDNIDGQKVKRRKSDMNMNQPKLPEPTTPNILLPSIDKKITADTNKTISNYRDIGFSPASSAQSDSCSNSNHTSESSTLSIPNAKQTQTDITGTINSTTDELEAKNSQIQNLIRERDELRRQLTDVKKDYDKQQNILQKCLAVNKKLLVEKSTLERKQARQKCMENRLRLGQFV